MIQRFRTWWRRRRLRRLGFTVLEWTEADGDALKSIESGVFIIDADEFLKRELFFEFEELAVRGNDTPRYGSRIVLRRWVQW